MELNKFINKNILILGFGSEGKSTFNFLSKYKINLSISDSNMDLVELYFKDLDIDNVNLDYGYLKDMDKYDYIFKTPGLPGFELKGIAKDKIYSQTRLFVELKGDKTIGITGTKGKSTTASLINNVLSHYKNSVLIGNIGLPALDAINSDYDYYVYEMSSFQTEFLSVGPSISIILNLFEEHLNNYESFDKYMESKINIFNKKNIYGCDNNDLKKFVKSNYFAFGHIENNTLNSDGFFIEKDNIIKLEKGVKSIVCSKDFNRNLLGEHNLVNMLTVFIVMDILNIEFSIETLSEFKGLHHRLELVYEKNNIKFYDDSISTIPASCISALKTIEDAKAVIIGGFDRHIDYTILINYLNSIDINVICMPDTGYHIYEELSKNKYKAKDMVEAVKKCLELTDSGSIVLSPAAPSYNFYKNFEERGDHFLCEVLKNFN